MPHNKVFIYTSQYYPVDYVSICDAATSRTRAAIGIELSKYVDFTGIVWLKFPCGFVSKCLVTYFPNYSSDWVLEPLHH